jgi:hypothetical protein
MDDNSPMGKLIYDNFIDKKRERRRITKNISVLSLFSFLFILTLLGTGLSMRNGQWSYTPGLIVCSFLTGVLFFLGLRDFIQVKRGKYTIRIYEKGLVVPNDRFIPFDDLDTVYMFNRRLPIMLNIITRTGEKIYFSRLDIGNIEEFENVLKTKMKVRDWYK